MIVTSWKSQGWTTVRNAMFTLQPDRGDVLPYRDVASIRQYKGVVSHDASRVQLGDTYMTENHFHGYSEHVHNAPAGNSMPELLERDPVSERRKRLSHALRFRKMEERFAKIPTDYGDTCNWVFETRQFLDWQDPTLLFRHHGFLWIKGKPGAGKSTIMKSAVRKAKKEQDVGQAVLSFFFDTSGDPLMRSTEGMYRSLLHQVVQDSPELFEEKFDDDILAYKQEGWPLERLKDLFGEVVQKLARVKHVTCYVDAIDEGDDDSKVRHMIYFMAELAETTAKKNLRFLVCFSSRHHPRISIIYSEELVLETHKGHKETIAGYIDRRLDPLIKTLELDVTKAIEVRASGVFLWVVLVVHELNVEFDRGTGHCLDKKLNAVPDDLQDLFTKVLKREGDKDGRLTASIQWVLYTINPMSRRELYSAIMISINATNADHLRFGANPEKPGSNLVSTEGMQRMILSSSRGLIEISGRGRTVDCIDLEIESQEIAQFIHESVKEFFLKGGLRHLDKTLSDNPTATSYQCLAHWCHRYFKFALADYFSELGTSLTSVNSPDRITFECKSWPLLQYAVDNMLEYAKRATEGGLHPYVYVPEPLVNVWLLIREKSRPHWKTCYPIQSMCTMLQVLCHEGHSGMVHTELERVAALPDAERTAYLDTRCRGGPLFKYGGALHIAIHAGHPEIIRALMHSGADLDERCSLYGTPLCFAIQNDHDDIAKELLSCGADVNMQNRPNDTALMLAVSKRKMDMVNLLLQHGAKVNDKGSQGRTAILNAVRTNSGELTRILLAHGADVRIEDSADKLNAVRYAKLHAPRILPIFLDYGIDVDANEFNKAPR